MDTTSFIYLLALAVYFSLDIFLLDVVTTYLYETLDILLYIFPPHGFLPNVPTPSLGKFTGLKMSKALYGLKPVDHMWYHHLKDFLISHGFLYNHALLCIFTLSQADEYVIVDVYVDDLHLIETSSLCKHTEKLLTSQFSMKLLGKTSFCLGLQLQHFAVNILLHRQAYTCKLLQHFQMDQVHALAVSIIGYSRTNADPYQPCSLEEEIINKHKYLTTVGAFTYLTTYTRLDIAFATNILARRS